MLSTQELEIGRSLLLDIAAERLTSTMSPAFGGFITLALTTCKWSVLLTSEEILSV